MLEFVPYPLLIGCAILVVLLTLLWQHKRGPSHLFFFAVFWIYLLAVVNLTLFPLPLPGRMDGGWARQSATFILSRVNLAPFYFGDLFFLRPKIVFFQLAGNVLLTVPFGFGISFVLGLKAKHFPWLAVAAGLCIETSQLVVSLVIGGAYRGVDINDVLLNATGVLIGYGFFRVFARVYLAILRRLEVEPQGLFACIRDVAGQAQSTGRATPGYAKTLDRGH